MNRLIFLRLLMYTVYFTSTEGYWKSYQKAVTDAAHLEEQQAPSIKPQTKKDAIDFIRCTFGSFYRAIHQPGRINLDRHPFDIIKISLQDALECLDSLKYSQP